jgi:transposase-like protein
MVLAKIYYQVILATKSERLSTNVEIEEIYRKFPSMDECIFYLEKIRWEGKPICPYCNSTRSTPVPQERRYHCHRCNTSFSVTTRTIFHRTHLPLQKWFFAISYLLCEQKPISARKLSKVLKINKNTAWHITSQVDKALFEAKQREFLLALVNFIGV